MTSVDISPPGGKDAIECVFSCDDAFCQHMAVTIVSLIKNNCNERINFHIVHSGLNCDNIARFRELIEDYPKCTLTFYLFDMTPYSHFRVDGHITLQTYLRLFMADVLPANIGKVIYLDADVVVLQTVRPLWETDIGDAMIAGVPDPFSQSSIARLGLLPQCTYINAGVLVINLALWRERQIVNTFLDVIEKKHAMLRFHDQDVLNYVFHDSIHLLEPKWNFQARARRKNFERLYGYHYDFASLVDDVAIVHFTTNKKPWNYRDAVPFESEYLKYIAFTPWRGFVQHGRTPLNAVMRHVDPPLETVSWQFRKLKTKLGLEVRH